MLLTMLFYRSYVSGWELWRRKKLYIGLEAHAWFSRSWADYSRRNMRNSW